MLFVTSIQIEFKFRNLKSILSGFTQLRFQLKMENILCVLATRLHDNYILWAWKCKLLKTIPLPSPCKICAYNVFSSYVACSISFQSGIANYWSGQHFWSFLRIHVNGNQFDNLDTWNFLKTRRNFFSVFST